VVQNLQHIFPPIIPRTFNENFKRQIFSNTYPDDITKRINDLLKNTTISIIDDIFLFSYKFMKIVRNRSLSIDIHNINKTDLIDVINKHLSDKFIPFMYSKNIDDFEKCFSEMTIDRSASKIQQKTFCYSFLCDMIGLTSEKNKDIEKDTFFASMMNDSLHLSLGIRCPFFVTNDMNLWKKAIVCKRLLDLPVKIFKMEQFNKYLLQTYMLPNFSKKDIKRFMLIYDRNEQGWFSKEYQVDQSDIYYD
jgi:hypothetical protein